MSHQPPKQQKKKPQHTPKEKKTFTLVLSASALELSFKGSSVKWARPSSTRLPNAVRDQRIPDTGDLITAPSAFFSLPTAAPGR